MIINEIGLLGKGEVNRLVAGRVSGGCCMNRDDLRLVVNSSVEGGEWAGEFVNE